MEGFEVPPFAAAEVTDDPRLTGGRLVVATRADLHLALQSFGINLMVEGDLAR